VPIGRYPNAKFRVPIIFAFRAPYAVLRAEFFGLGTIVLGLLPGLLRSGFASMHFGHLMSRVNCAVALR
jgi:hypothetical protein